MAKQLYIRPDYQDLGVLRDVLAPPGPVRTIHAPPVTGLVIDAHLAEANRGYAELAREVGVRALIDPLTFNWQIEASPTSPFARLPYGADRSSILAHGLSGAADRVVEFEISHGGSTLVIPYLHVDEPAGLFANLNLDLMVAAADAAERHDVRLPAIAVLSGDRQKLTTPDGLAYIDRFVSQAVELGVGTIAMCTSPAGGQTDSVGSILRVLTIADRIRLGGLPVIAWRQGAYGLALSAAGLDGYETGIGQLETTNIRNRMNSTQNHRPIADDEEFLRPKRPVMMGIWHRSLVHRAADVLLRSPLAGEVMCTTPGCCSTVATTLERQRHHAVRTRAHQLDQLGERLGDRPARWHLTHYLNELAPAIGTARRANEILASAGERSRLPVAALTALAEALDRWAQAGAERGGRTAG